LGGAARLAADRWGGFWFFLLTAAA
jgi:hypothetical protein